jgi:hypothetical protein
MDNIKMDLRERGQGGMDWIDLALDMYQWKVREYGNEPLGSTKCWEFLEHLHNWWPPKKKAELCELS